MTPEPTIRRGTNVPIAFTLPSGFDMAGATFTLAVVWNAGRRDYAVGSGLTLGTVTTPDGVRDAVIWNYPLADVAAFPEGRVSRTELQWRRGAVDDSDAGYLTITPGISID
jgi:hypothetical protein